MREAQTERRGWWWWMGARTGQRRRHAGALELDDRGGEGRGWRDGSRQAHHDAGVRGRGVAAQRHRVARGQVLGTAGEQRAVSAVIAGREIDGARAVGQRRVDRCLNRGTVVVHAVPDRAEGGHLHRPPARAAAVRWAGWGDEVVLAPGGGEVGGSGGLPCDCGEGEGGSCRQRHDTGWRAAVAPRAEEKGVKPSSSGPCHGTRCGRLHGAVQAGRALCAADSWHWLSCQYMTKRTSGKLSQTIRETTVLTSERLLTHYSNH